MASFPVLKSRRDRTTWIACRAPGQPRWLNAATLSRRISSRWWAWSRVRCPSGMFRPGQLPDLGVQAGMVILHDSHVVSAAADQIGPVIMLGVQGVGGYHRVL
jgi:hypothetical protein